MLTDLALICGYKHCFEALHHGCRGLGDEALAVGEMYLGFVIQLGEIHALVVVVATHSITLAATVRVDECEDFIL